MPFLSAAAEDAESETPTELIINPQTAHAVAAALSLVLSILSGIIAVTSAMRSDRVNVEWILASLGWAESCAVLWAQRDKGENNRPKTDHQVALTGFALVQLYAEASSLFLYSRMSLDSLLASTMILLTGVTFGMLILRIPESTRRASFDHAPGCLQKTMEPCLASPLCSSCIRIDSPARSSPDVSLNSTASSVYCVGTDQNGDSSVRLNETGAGVNRVQSEASSTGSFLSHTRWLPSLNAQVPIPGPRRSLRGDENSAGWRLSSVDNQHPRTLSQDDRSTDGGSVASLSSEKRFRGLSPTMLRNAKDGEVVVAVRDLETVYTNQNKPSFVVYMLHVSICRWHDGVSEDAVTDAWDVDVRDSELAMLVDMVATRLADLETPRVVSLERKQPSSGNRHLHLQDSEHPPPSSLSSSSSSSSPPPPPRPETAALRPQNEGGQPGLLPKQIPALPPSFLTSVKLRDNSRSAANRKSLDDLKAAHLREVSTVLQAIITINRGIMVPLVIQQLLPVHTEPRMVTRKRHNAVQLTEEMHNRLADNQRRREEEFKHKSPAGVAVVDFRRPVIEINTVQPLCPLILPQDAVSVRVELSKTDQKLSGVDYESLYHISVDVGRVQWQIENAYEQIKALDKMIRREYAEKDEWQRQRLTLPEFPRPPTKVLNHATQARKC